MSWGGPFGTCSVLKRCLAKSEYLRDERGQRAQELPVTIPELATMGPSWAPDGTEVMGSSSSSVFRVDALTGQQLRGYREAGGKLSQGKDPNDSGRASSTVGEFSNLPVCRA